ncbi:sestrin-like protein [Plakobranchus ocellatus]|uniref:Sestrin-like protein n=1 Tax=Plakobranchus ocellatus TaxID=259542 RepID=A0AAV4AE87_9GAST|nr:sestrin-like protein [Plakobranchus ocellatus]
MPNFAHYVAILDSQYKQNLDLNLCAECIDNVNINQDTSQNLELKNEPQTENVKAETVSHCGSYYSTSMPIPLPPHTSYKLSNSRPNVETSKNNSSLSKCPRSRPRSSCTNIIPSSPCLAQTCVDSFYTPTKRSLPPIIGMHDLQNSHLTNNAIIRNSECVVNEHFRKENYNAFHFPKSNGVELPNGYIPWDSELNDSDCDDGVFDREQVEDMNIDLDTEPNIEQQQAITEVGGGRIESFICKTQIRVKNKAKPWLAACSSTKIALNEMFQPTFFRWLMLLSLHVFLLMNGNDANFPIIMINWDLLRLSSTCDQFIVPSYSADEQTHNLFMDAFIQNNRLDCVSQVMGYHPDYLRIFLSTQNFLLREDGPLSYEYRHYIAILAAARHHCTYLVELHEQDFLLHNGNPEWLKGLEYAPKKLQDLYEINKLLAHQPWLITKEHMVKLLKSSEPWSMSELMHAIILLTHFHALSSFVFGCGISSQIDSQGGNTYTESVLTSSSPPAPPTSSSASPSSSAALITHSASPISNGKSTSGSPRESVELVQNMSMSGFSNICVTNGTLSSSQIVGDESAMDVEALMEKMRQLTRAAGGETSQEELLKRFHSVEKNTAEIAVPNMKKPDSKSEIAKYVLDDDFAYTDFATRKCVNVSTFRACDYSWEDHGFSLANRLYADIGNYLDDKYSTAANMTYYTMGDLREVDTSSFRRAIWNYIHTMYGICHDDYDYAEVNQLLEIKLKAYIKTLTCYPERLQKKDFEGVMKGFKHSEKVHVNLMLMEARQQAELLYALRALNRYLT